MWFIYYPPILYLSYKIFIHVGQASDFYQSSIEKLDLGSQTELAWKSFLESLTLNLYEGASDIQNEIGFLKQQAQSHLQQADILSIIFAVLTLFYIIYLFVYHRSNKDRLNKQITIHLTIIALICLIMGVSMPMLNLIAFKDLPVLGTIVFKYESKSILSVIQTLWQSQQYFISSLVVLFSLILPLGKLLLSFLAILSKQERIRQQFAKLIHAIGKWSMTDVFVIAVLLAFFTMNTDETTNAWLGHGLYFFASYSILSLWVGHLISGGMAQQNYSSQ